MLSDILGLDKMSWGVRVQCLWTDVPQTKRTRLLIGSN